MPDQTHSDALFNYPCERIQVEFVVDNLSVAGLANSTVAIINQAYGPIVIRIRRLLSSLYRICNYKASFMDPVEWRAREWNKGADHLASYCLSAREDGGILTADSFRHALVNSVALQFFTDGGFVRGAGGAVGVQLIAHYWEKGCLQRRMVGCKYMYKMDAVSAFELELLALETALNLTI